MKSYVNEISLFSVIPRLVFAHLLCYSIFFTLFFILLFFVIFFSAISNFFLVTLVLSGVQFWKQGPMLLKNRRTVSCSGVQKAMSLKLDNNTKESL